MTMVLFLVAISCVISCVPMSSTSGISDLPDIENKFDDASERIIVIPLWLTYPFVSAEGQTEIYILGKPIFSTVRELPDLSTIIPAKTSLSLMGIATAVGKIIYIDSVIVISETGTMISIQCPNGSGKVRCEQFYEDYVFPQWRNDIIHDLVKSNGKTVYPDQSIKELIDSFPRQVEISYSIEELQSIIAFLEGMVHLKDPFSGYTEKGMNKKTGEPCRDDEDCALGYFCKHHKCIESRIIPPSVYKP